MYKYYFNLGGDPTVYITAGSSGFITLVHNTFSWFMGMPFLYYYYYNVYYLFLCFIIIIMYYLFIYCIFL